MKSNSKTFWVTGIFLLIVSMLFYACKKEISIERNIPTGSTKFSVFLTDGPNDYQHVLIDIQRMEVKLDTCQHNFDDDHNQPGCDDDHDRRNSTCEIWDTLDIRPGIYDLLKLRNGLDTLIASGFILNGKIIRIKLTLGDKNSVMADSMVHPLQLLNGQHFVYVNINRDHLDSISSNNFQLYLDFDLTHSIKYRNGQYWLRPVLKPFGKHSSGEIEGKIRPVHSFGMIMAYNITDTAYARPENEGEFKIRGLSEGTYSLFIDGINGYKDTTLTNIDVKRNKDVNLGTIQLHL